MLFKQNQREIKSMRDAVDFGGGGVSGGAGELAGAAQFAGKSQAQLVALLQEREQAIEVLTMKYEQQRARHEVTEARLAEQAEARDGEMKRVAQTAAPKPQNTRILETLVARLKTQMSQKDKRLAQLKEAIKELEKKLVDAMQKAAEASARGAEARSGENAAVRSAGDSRATVLAAKLKKTQDELQKAKQREERWEEERERLVRESRSATDAAVRSSAAARRETAAARRSAVAAADDADSLRASAAHDDRAERLADANQKCDELENRVKVLLAQNAKLNRLLRAEQSEAALAKAAAEEDSGRGPRRQSASSENRPPGPAAEEDPGAGRRREETLARWEEGVKLRKRAETLTKKLSAATRERDDAAGQCAKLRAHVVELQREKAALGAKAKAASEEARRGGELSRASAAQGALPDAQAAEAIARENEALHREISGLRRVVDVEQAAEISRLKRLLAETEAPREVAKDLPADVEALAARVAALEGEILQRDDQALGLKFEAEQAAARADRLQRRVDQLFRGASEEAARRPVAPGAASASARELEDVVEALKRVVEKQQSELAAARGAAAMAARGADQARAAKEAKAKAKALAAEVATLQASKERAKALELENAKLKKDLAAAADASATTAAAPARPRADAEALLAAAQAEAADAALALAETRDELRSRTRQLADAREDAARAVAAAAAGAAGADGDAAEAARLRAENADLRAELDALDPAFFDEVMEMKRHYHAQAKVLEKYEDLLGRYAAQLGVPFEPIDAGSGSS